MVYNRCHKLTQEPEQPETQKGVQVKPIIILPKNVMSPEHIKKLQENDLCVVEADNPALVKFVDPIPAMKDRSKVEDAALRFSRILLTGRGLNNGTSYNSSHSEICRLYVSCLLEGTDLSAGPTQQEREQAYFNAEKMDEIRRLARQEAKEERDAAKKAIQEKSKK